MILPMEAGRRIDTISWGKIQACQLNLGERERQEQPAGLSA